jgi:hypothetical protein
MAVESHDQDTNDCKQLRRQLSKLCNEAGHPDVLVRIACYELEAWYCGDLDALGQVYPNFNAAAASLPGCAGFAPADPGTVGDMRASKFFVVNRGRLG